jgi:hypothetical protein
MRKKAGSPCARLSRSMPKAELEKALRNVANDLGAKDLHIGSETGKVTLDMQIDALAKIHEKKDLERILAENGNNNH